MLAKILKSIVLLFIALVLGVAAFSFTPDGDAATTTSMYSNEESEFVTLPNGLRIHYRDQGNPVGPALVLIHGSNASLHTWEPLAARLGDRYRFITLDMQGHGLTGPIASNDYSLASMVSTVYELTDILEIDRFFIGGNSMGGGISAGFALAYPDLVEGLILLDAAGLPFSLDRDSVPTGFKLAAVPALAPIVRSFTPRSLIRDGLEKSFYDQSLVTDSMVTRYYDLFIYPGNRAATAERFQAHDPTTKEIAAEDIATPTLVLWGDKDGVIPVRLADDWMELLPNARKHIFKDVGHLPMEEAPGAVAEQIDGFIREILSSSQPQLPNGSTTETDQSE